MSDPQQGPKRGPGRPPKARSGGGPPQDNPPAPKTAPRPSLTKRPLDWLAALPPYARFADPDNPSKTYAVDRKADLRVLARSFTVEAVKTLVEIARGKNTPPAARVAAASAILDRGWGRAVTPVAVAATAIPDQELRALAAQVLGLPSPHASPASPAGTLLANASSVPVQESGQDLGAPDNHTLPYVTIPYTTPPYTNGIGVPEELMQGGPIAPHVLGDSSILNVTDSEEEEESDYGEEEE